MQGWCGLIDCGLCRDSQSLKGGLMDPTACLLELLEAIQARNPDEIRQRAIDLASWIRSEGFSPEGIDELVKFYRDNH